MKLFGNNKEKVEFRGVSRSSEKRNAIVLFVIEAVVVLIFIAGVLFVLNYFGIFPFLKTNTVFLEEEKTEDVVVPAQRGYGPGDDSSDWKPPDWMK